MRRYKVLFADDDPAIVKSLTIRLRSEGFDVITAEDSYQALQLARQHMPDVLLLDINMPAGDGFSVQDRITKMPDISHIPVIYLTGERSDRVRIGANLHHSVLIHKPFQTQDLVDEIRTAIAASNEQPVTS